VAPQHLGAGGVEDRRVRVADDVGRDDGILAVFEDALHRSVGRPPDGVVDLVDGDVTLQLDDEVDGRPVRYGHPHRHAVEFALQLGQHFPDCLGGTRGGGDDVLGGGAAPPQVLVGDVGETLIVGVGVDGGHHAALDAVLVVEIGR